MGQFVSTIGRIDDGQVIATSTADYDERGANRLNPDGSARYDDFKLNWLRVDVVGGSVRIRFRVKAQNPAERVLLMDQTVSDGKSITYLATPGTSISDVSVTCASSIPER